MGFFLEWIRRDSDISILKFYFLRIPLYIFGFVYLFLLPIYLASEIGFVSKEDYYGNNWILKLLDEPIKGLLTIGFMYIWYLINSFVEKYISKIYKNYFKKNY